MGEKAYPRGTIDADIMGVVTGLGFESEALTRALTDGELNAGTSLYRQILRMKEFNGLNELTTKLAVGQRKPPQPAPQLVYRQRSGGAILNGTSSGGLRRASENGKIRGMRSFGTLPSDDGEGPTERRSPVPIRPLSMSGANRIAGGSGTAPPVRPLPGNSSARRLVCPQHSQSRPPPPLPRRT